MPAEKNNQTTSNLSENIHTTRIGLNSAFRRYIKPSVERKKISKKKPMLVQPSKKEIGKLIKQAISPIEKPATNITIKKPINEHDRFNALIRIPEVQEALSKIDKEKNKKKRVGLARCFYRKYNVPPARPKDIRKYKSYDPDVVQALCSFELDSTKSLSRYRDGKHLIIVVNLTKKNQDIFNEFKRIIKQVRKDYRIPQDTTRDRDLMLNIWDVYDLRNKGMKWSVI